MMILRSRQHAVAVLKGTKHMASSPAIVSPDRLTPGFSIFFTAAYSTSAVNLEREQQRPLRSVALSNVMEKLASQPNALDPPELWNPRSPLNTEIRKNKFISSLWRQDRLLVNSMIIHTAIEALRERDDFLLKMDLIHKSTSWHKSSTLQNDGILYLTSAEHRQSNSEEYDFA